VEPRGGLVATLRADLNPVAWKSPTAYAIRRGGSIRAAMAPAVEVRAYQEALAEMFREQWGDRPTITDPVCLQWKFARRLVSYESATGRTVTKHRQDGTNLQKAAEDALQASGVIKNDVQVHAWSGVIVEQSKDVSDPFVEVAVWLLPA
jgi:Holliday junction resolvase RusA-like endonuclease